MPDTGATLLGILALTVATYLTRIAGYLVGSRVRPDSVTARVLDVLPGAALSGVLALSLVKLTPAGQLAVLAAAVVFLLSRHTLLAIATGLLIAIGHAHLLA